MKKGELSDLAVRAKLSRGTVRRALLTLQALGYLHEDAGRFTLTPRTLRTSPASPIPWAG